MGFLTTLLTPLLDETLYWARDVELARVHSRFIESFHLRCSDEYDVTGDLIGTFADLDRENPHEPGDWNSRLMRDFTKYLEEAEGNDALPMGWDLTVDNRAVLYDFCYRSFRNRTEHERVEKTMLRRIAADVLGTSVDPVVGGSWFDETETDESEYSDEDESEYDDESDESKDYRLKEIEAPRARIDSDPKTCATCGATERADDAGGKHSCFQCTGCRLVRYCSKACQ